MSATTKGASTSENMSPKSGGGGGDNKARDIENIRKNLAKRSFHIKFDLDDTDYQPIEKIGIGAYGVVCSAIHTKTNEKVAIKKIPCVFEALDIAKRTYREIKILRHFKHDNIISIQEILKPKESFHEFKDIYVVFDLMESDLHRIIYSEQPLTEEHIRYFLYQILRGLKYIHSANVVHRDLKPSNLLVNEDCHVRIGDFGMARGVNSQRDEPSHYMTQYVATRWYRAPEILLSLLEYGTAVDMWSVGCIFAEMLGRKHLFPGKDYLSQVKLVLGVLGSPSEVVIKQCQSDVLRRIIKSLGHRQPLPWTTMFPKATKKALDLLSKMLLLNPADRITVQTALRHPFLSKYHDPDDEPICVPSFEFDFEKELYHMDRDHLREVIYKEVMDFHQARTPTLSFSACLRPAPKPGESGAPEPAFPESFKDQLQSYMSSFTQAACGQDTKTEEAVQQSSHPESSGAPITVAVPSSMTTTTTNDEQDIFKRPADRTSKKSPVSVDTGSLQLPNAADIEMLSAQSTGSSVMDMHTPHTPLVEKQETEKEKKAGEKKATETKTISEDTKALVKQALLSHRQRTESCGDDDKPRPVTAAQRQREREEKRRKKKDREKMKKVHDKKNAAQEQLLSDADKELLARWECMQKIKNQAEGQQTVAIVTTSSTGVTAATVVYLQHNYPATPSPPQPAAGFSPPHPGPASTPPSVQHAGLVTQGQVAVVQGQATVSQGQACQQDVQLSQVQMAGLPQTQIAGSSVSPGQNYCARTSFHEGQFVSFVDMSQHAGTQLHITSSQAEAIKEALKLQNLSIVPTSSNSGPAADGVVYRHVPTPPQNIVSGNQDQMGVKGHTDGSSGQNQQVYSTAQSGSNQYNRVSQQGFNHVNGQEAGGSQMAANRFSSGNVSGTDSSQSSQDPQDLSEFLDRHCQPEEKVVASLSDIKPFGAADTKSFAPQSKLDTGPGLFAVRAAGGQVKPEALHGSMSFPNLADSKVYFGQQTRPTSDCSLEARQGQSCIVASSSGYQEMIRNPQQPYFLPPNANVNFPPAHHAQSMQFGEVSSTASIQNSNQYHGFTPSRPTVQMLDVKSRFSLPVTFAMSQQSHLSQPHMLGAGDTQQLSMGGVSQPSHFQTPVQTQQGGLNSLAHAATGTIYGASGMHKGVDQQQLHQHPQQQQYTGMVQQQSQSPSHHHGQHPQDHISHSQPPAPQQPQAGPSRAPELRVSAPPHGQDTSADLLALIKQMSKSQLDTILPPSLSLTPRGTGGGYGVGMDLDVLMADTMDNTGLRNEMSPLSSSLLADWLEMTGNISQADLDALEHDFSMTSPVPMPFSEYQNPSNQGSWS